MPPRANLQLAVDAGSARQVGQGRQPLGHVIPDIRRSVSLAPLNSINFAQLWLPDCAAQLSSAGGFAQTMRQRELP